MRKSIILAVFFSFITLPAAFAKDRPYGMAGCGLGSQIFKGSSDMASQIFASTTNGTSDTQTFGISSGTSNCTDDGVVTSQVPMFIETNQIALANDIARGNGETLAHLSKVLGCSDSRHFNTTLQRNYDTIFTTENIKSSKVTGSLMEVLKSDAKLAGKCKNVI